MAINIGLLPRPWSGHIPLVEGFEPKISHRVTRINRRRKNSWRCEVLVDDIPMSTSHHNTKAAAESMAEKMLEATTESHYYSQLSVERYRLSLVHSPWPGPGSCP